MEFEATRDQLREQSEELSGLKEQLTIANETISNQQQNQQQHVTMLQDEMKTVNAKNKQFENSIEHFRQIEESKNVEISSLKNKNHQTELVGKWAQNEICLANIPSS